MTHCKHDWKESTEALQGVFSEGSPSRHHRFWVCERCLRITEGAAQPTPLERAARAERDVPSERRERTPGEAA